MTIMKIAAAADGKTIPDRGSAHTSRFIWQYSIHNGPFF